MQGHSRQDLDDKEAYDVLEPHEVLTLLAHGSYWRHYSSIFQHGLQPGGRSTQRRHTHLIDADVPATEIRSGFRDSQSTLEARETQPQARNTTTRAEYALESEVRSCSL